MKKTLDINPLSQADFAPFGQVIEAGPSARHFPINEGNTTRFHDLMRIETDPEGHPIVSIFRGQARSLPFNIKMVERHPKGSQSFMPLSGRPYLVVVAPAGAPPDTADLRAFYCQGHQGVNYGKGVWHHPLLALEHTSDFLVIDRAGPGDNCDVHRLIESAWLTLKY